MTAGGRLYGDWIHRPALIAVLALILSIAIGQAPFRRPPSAEAAQAMGARARAPLMFVENVGQFAPAARYRLDSGATALALAEDGLWLTIPAIRRAPAHPGEDTTAERSTHAVQLKLSFVGANPHPRLEALERLDTRVAYLTGADPRAWRTDVPAWGGVRYRDLYPGVDLELGGLDGRLSARMIVDQAADLQPVRMRVEGADDITIVGSRLRLTTALGAVEFPLPQAVSAGGSALPLRGMAPSRQGGDIAHPFAAAPPVEPAAPQAAADLIYSTFIGGGDYDEGDSIAIDASGAAYIVGYTTSGNFPTTAGAVDLSPSGYNATIVKVKPDGSGLEYAAIVGGSEIEYATGVAVDASGAAYVAGYTASDDFPTTAGAYDRAGGGVDKLHRDIFIFKLNAAASNLIYSTYIGGSGDERTSDLAVDISGAAYVTGSTPSTNFPTTAGAYDSTHNGGTDVYMVKLDPSGSRLDYATYLGGGGNEKGNGITVDPSGAAYVVGRTASVDFPAVNAYDMSANGADDVFVTRLNATGTDLIYSTYLGGSGIDDGLAIAIDTSGAAYLAGFTSSITFPATPGAYDTTPNGGEDGFTAKLGPSGAVLNYASYLGGAGDDEGRGIAINASGEAHLTGFTSSANFPIRPGTYDPSFNGVTDAFVVKLNNAGSGLAYASFLGGSDLDSGDAIALDRQGLVYLTGEIRSANFPTTPGAYSPSFNGGPNDQFAAKFRIGEITPPRYTISGHVYGISGTPVAGVTISANGRSTTTNANGSYELSELDPGGYRIVPSKVGYQFDPPAKDVQLSADLPGQDFRVITSIFSVSGRVIDNGTRAGLAGVTISTGVGDSATTRADGSYVLRLASGRYTLTVSRSDYTFTPPARVITVAAADIAVPPFTATLVRRQAPPHPIFLPLTRRDPPSQQPRPCDDYEPNNDRRTNPTPISLGQVITAKICQDEHTPQPDPYYEDTYSLTTTQGAPLQVRLTLPATLINHIALAVYDSTAPSLPLNRCYQNPVSTAPFTLRCVIPDTGTYIVRLYSDGTADNARTYTLYVTQ